MLYKSLIKPLLFSISPETAHHLVMNQLKFAFRMPLVKGLFQRAFCVTDKSLETEVAGLRFPNRVGLAAGFDKDAVAFDELSAFGFGFIEIGTVTPKPQDGNPKPRLFRLPADEALINRMGFNNSGVDLVRNRLESRSGKLIIGGNIGKNKVTPNENAVDDYLICFKALRDCVDYFVVNISSPNTPGLRELQDREPLIALLSAVMAENRKGIPKPVFLKIAPDLTASQVDDIIGIVQETGLAGMVISNTTISRDGLKTPAGMLEEIGAGGLSGKPVFQRSTDLVRYVSEKSHKRFAIIASGGIVSAEDAIAKLEAGADLVQLYTGFIYEGPGLVKKILRALIKN